MSKRIQGELLIRVVGPRPSPTFQGTRYCACGAKVPKGTDRPFCVECSPYARKVRVK